MNGTIDKNAKVNCRNMSIIINGDIHESAKIICAGSALFNGDIGDNVKITTKGSYVFAGRVGKSVKVNGKVVIRYRGIK